MSASPISAPGIPSPADPAVAAAVDRWVAAAGEDTPGVLAAVVSRVAEANGSSVVLVVNDIAVRPAPAALAVDVAAEVLVRAGPWLPGFVREVLLAPAARRGGGVHHTSPAMAGALVDVVGAIAPWSATTTVVDPAVGGGVFLLAACEAMSGPRAARVGRVMGFDIDPLAVAVTNAALELWAGGAAPKPGAIRVADGLAPADLDDRVDLVIGNPPFLAQLRDDTTRDDDRRASLRERWPDVGGYVDDAAAFLLAGIDMVRDGGVVALVQPASFLAARDTGAVRDRLLREAPPAGLWIDGDRQFAAAVDTVALVVRRGSRPDLIRRYRGVPAVELAPHPAPRPTSSWASLLADDAAPTLAPNEARVHGRVADVAAVTAGFRDQFYGLRGAVSEDPVGRHPLITSGLIDPLECRWGRTPCRFDRSSWTYPCVDPAAVDPAIRTWIADRLVPKLLVASQTRTIEVAIDGDGRLIPCTPVVSVEPVDGAPSLSHLAAALTSPVAAALLLTEAAGSALSRDAMRVSAASIGAIPLPPVGAEWDAAAAAVRALGPIPDRSALVEVGRLAMVAYGVGDRSDLLNWWRERLPRR